MPAGGIFSSGRRLAALAGLLTLAPGVLAATAYWHPARHAR